MLKSFSWQDFLLAATLLTLIWCVVVWLCYRKTGNQSETPLPHSWENDFEDLGNDDDLMGKTTLEHGVSVVNADDFSFSETPPEQEHDSRELVGDIADVQQEIKLICNILATEDGSKADFFQLFAAIKTKYPRVASSALLPQLNNFISEHVPFHLDQQELDQLWL